MAPRKIIIDTDPGVDDILAMLLAFSALPSELEVLLISITYGNIDLQNCLRNAISMFHHIDQEIAARQAQGRNPGFDSLRKTKPLVALGPVKPLADQLVMAAYFHGVDGLGGIHESHPQFTPADTWKQLFATAEQSTDLEHSAIAEEMQKTDSLFTPSRTPSHQEILRLLRENEPDSITIVAIGPLTNLALAAAEDPETFLRAKEVVVMGGTIDDPGNITPKAEFNTFADSIAAARLYALTSPKPHTTLPPVPPAPPGQTQGQYPPPFLAPYPAGLSRRLKVTLFPLDVTGRHLLSRGEFRTIIDAQKAGMKSPLAEWMEAFIEATYRKIESLGEGPQGDDLGLQLHDPLCIWYTMTSSDPAWHILPEEDIRVETSGQWTRGMCVVDRRGGRGRPADDGDESEVPGDPERWLSAGFGNRLRRCVDSPGRDVFGREMLRRIFAL